MKLGDTFKHKHNGAHGECTLIILHDDEINHRVLYDVDCGCVIGNAALLYAKYTGNADTKYYSEMLERFLKSKR